MKSLVLDLAVDPEVAARLSDRLPGPAVVLRLSELKELEPWRALRRLRATRVERCVVVVNDVRAEPRWLSILGLALCARAGAREVVDAGGRVRPVRWASVLRREIPFVVKRSRVAARVRRRVRREVARLQAAGPVRPIRPNGIVFIRADLSPSLDAGGSLAHIHGVVGGFERLGHPVTFVTPGPVRGFDEDGRRVHRVPLDGRHLSLPEHPYLAYNLDLIPRAEEILRSSGADLVYHRHALGCYGAAAAARACGLPLVVEFNGSEVWVARNWGDGLARAELFEEIERRALRAADLVVAVSEALRPQLHDAGVPDGRILVNPNGVDPERFDPRRLQPGRREVRRRLEVGEDEILVGFVGTFGPWHGAEVLAEAAGAVPDGWAGRLRFLFIGDGVRRGATEELLRRCGRHERAIFAGLVPQEQTPELLAACDLCVSPHVPNPDGTPFFGSPTKLFEYLATGRAVVASRLGQIGELLDHDRTAWLVPPGDATALADAIVRLAGDPESRARLGRAGREEACSRHSWTAHVRRILDRLAEPAGPGATP